MSFALDPDLDLELVRDLNAPRAALWTCWTDPQHLPHWFVPKPHKVVACALDLRGGGRVRPPLISKGPSWKTTGFILR